MLQSRGLSRCNICRYNKCTWGQYFGPSFFVGLSFIEFPPRLADSSPGRGLSSGTGAAGHHPFALRAVDHRGGVPANAFAAPQRAVRRRARHYGEHKLHASRRCAVIACWASRQRRGRRATSRHADKRKDLPQSPGLRARVLPRQWGGGRGLIRNCRPKIGSRVQTWAGEAGAAIQGEMTPATSLRRGSGCWTR